MRKFIKGMTLNRMFYKQIIAPLMSEHFPALRYSAGLVGHGSDVIGFDTPQSMDHNWGPFLHIFFDKSEFDEIKPQVDRMLKRSLPYTFKGFSVHFVKGNKYLVDVPRLKKTGNVHHLFHFWTIESFFQHYLGFDVHKTPTYQDWLLFPQQALIEVTAGNIFYDGLRTIIPIRKKFTYYPDDIWKYMMRVQWGKILDELQMPARSGEEGDEVGSLIVTARTIRKIIFLCFLQEKRYAPYSKWYGLAFKTWLTSGKKFYPSFLKILHEKDWLVRQKMLARVFQSLGKIHNGLRITKPLNTKLMDFFGRGYVVINIWEYVQALEQSIENPTLRAFKHPLGSVDQFIDHARINHMDYAYWQLKDIIQ